jgi:hypothetical protein
MEPEPEPEPEVGLQRDAATDDHDGSESSGGGWEDDYESEPEAEQVEREPVAQPRVAAAPAQRKVKGRGARRYEMHESSYELGNDRLGSGGARGVEGRGDRLPRNVLEVVMLRGRESSMLVLQELEEAARQCSSTGMDTTVELRWFPADCGTGALAVFRSAAAANAALRQVKSNLFTLVASDDASEVARSMPVEDLGPMTRQATTSTAANRMLTSALGLPGVRVRCCVAFGGFLRRLCGCASLTCENTKLCRVRD